MDYIFIRPHYCYGLFIFYFKTYKLYNLNINISMQPKKSQPFLRFIHFNDNYDIQPNQKTKLGGAYYFKSHLQKFWNSNTLTFFSGDAFSPSVLSTLYEGQQMVHCLKEFKIDVACYGNHQFDYEYQHTLKLSKACGFPWLLGNLIELNENSLLGEGLQHFIIQKNGKRIGLFGVAEEQWLQLLTEQYQQHLKYIDFVEFSQKKLKYLKQQQKCDIIIALTHMRVPHDKLLAEKVQELDFVLGGHDHKVHNQKLGNVHIIKSGCNFQRFSVIDLYEDLTQGQYSNKTYSYDIHLELCDPTNDYDLELKNYVDSKMERFNIENNKIVAYTQVPLEVRFEIVRAQQTNYGNFCADLISSYYNCDGVFLQSGGIRLDQVVEAGPLKLSTISNIFDAQLVVKYVSGKTVLEALQNSCSKYPSLQGRFLQISGIKYAFDANLPGGNRVIKDSIQINRGKLDLNKTYKIAMYNYIATGNDGYQMLSSCKYHIEPQNSIKMLALLTRFFKPSSLQEQQEQSLQAPKLIRRKSSKKERMSELINNILLKDGLYYIQISPKVEGRIIILNAAV